MTYLKAKVLQTLLAEGFASLLFGMACYSTVLGSYQSQQSSSPLLVGLSLGLSSIGIIFALCDVTIAHFNPAITLSAILTKKLNLYLGGLYIAVQFVGYLLAGFLTVASFPGNYEEKVEIFRPKPYSKYVSRGTIFGCEFFLTFILVFIVFAVGVNPYIPPVSEDGVPLDPATKVFVDRSISGPISIGATITFLSFMGLSSSGGVFNPWLGLSPMILSGTWDFWYLYLLGDFAGGLVGAFLQVYLLTKIY